MEMIILHIIGIVGCSAIGLAIQVYLMKIIDDDDYGYILIAL